VVPQFPPKAKKKAPDQPTTGDVIDVDVIKDDKAERISLKIVEPMNARNPISKWAVDELTRGQFNASIGRAIVHSKEMVIDPFTDHPVVSPAVTTSPSRPARETTRTSSSSATIHRSPRRMRYTSWPPTTTTVIALHNKRIWD
jgi:hypothetical protein